MPQPESRPTVPDPSPPPWVDPPGALPEFYRPLMDRTREKERIMGEARQAWQTAGAALLGALLAAALPAVVDWE